MHTVQVPASSSSGAPSCSGHLCSGPLPAPQYPPLGDVGPAPPTLDAAWLNTVPALRLGAGGCVDNGEPLAPRPFPRPFPRPTPHAPRPFPRPTPHAPRPTPHSHAYPHAHAPRPRPSPLRSTLYKHAAAAATCGRPESGLLVGDCCSPPPYLDHSMRRPLYRPPVLCGVCPRPRRCGVLPLWCGLHF